ADGSVGPPHARVGNCQASNKRQSLSESWGFFVCVIYEIYAHCDSKSQPVQAFKSAFLPDRVFTLAGIFICQRAFIPIIFITAYSPSTFPFVIPSTILY
ncbi:hypothetical protein, partial [Mixta calida]